MSDTEGWEALVATMPHAQALGVRVDSAAPEQVRAHLEFSTDKCTAGGALHGGVVMALADSVGALCAYLNLPPEATTATIESKTNFFRAVREGSVHAVSRPLHVGRTTIAIQTDLVDDRDRRVAHTTQTQAIVPAPT